ncbi:MAG: septum formation family protein [Rhodoglobus sp.]
MSIKAHTMRASAVVVFIVTLATVSLGGCSLPDNPRNESTSPDTPSAIAEETGTDVFDIKLGNCFNNEDVSKAGEVNKVKILDCSQPHDAEAFKKIIMPGTSFPGDKAVSDAAVAGCTSAFTTYVGIEYDQSKLDFAYFYPTAATWEEESREILCIVVDPAGKVSGTLAGAAR